jgi:hypothetical protein
MATTAVVCGDDNGLGLQQSFLSYDFVNVMTYDDLTTDAGAAEKTWLSGPAKGKACDGSTLLANRYAFFQLVQDDPAVAQTDVESILVRHSITTAYQPSKPNP